MMSAMTLAITWQERRSPEIAAAEAKKNRDTMRADPGFQEFTVIFLDEPEARQ